MLRVSLIKLYLKNLSFNNIKLSLKSLQTSNSKLKIPNSFQILTACPLSMLRSIIALLATALFAIARLNCPHKSETHVVDTCDRDKGGTHAV